MDTYNIIHIADEHTMRHFYFAEQSRQRNFVNISSRYYIF